MTDDELRKLAEKHIAGFERVRAGGPILLEDVAVDTESLARAVLRLLEERARWPGPHCDDPDDVIAERFQPQLSGPTPPQYVGRCCHGITSQGGSRSQAINMTLEACALAHETKAAP
jgi:hypothetical protein